MRIAYLSTFYPFRGGIAQFNARLLKSLSKFGETRAFTFKRQYPDLLFPGKSQFVQPEDNAEPIESLRVLDTINPVSYFSTARVIKSFAPEILITKFWMPFFAIPLGTVLRSLKKATFNVSILDNVVPHERHFGDIAATKFFLHQNHLFVVMSSTVERDLLTLFPEANFIRLVHPLYDHFGKQVDKTEARQILKLPTDRFILLFFGFIREYKGLDLLLKALALLPNEFHLVVAGETYSSFDKYNRLVRDLQLENRTSFFVRYIPDHEVPLFFSSADLCVLPYKSATQSGIVGISYHFDLPVVATKVGSLAEMLEPFGSGLIAPSPTPESISQTIMEFAKKPKNQFIEGIHKYKAIANWDYFAKHLIESCKNPKHAN